MTVPTLINEILRRLEQQFYAHLPRRDFKRDQGYLVAAIGTYGWECRQRGWEFDLEFIYRDLCRIVQSFKTSGTAIEWMPNYLQCAIRQHIREHADELRCKAAVSKVPRLAKRIVDGAQLAKVVVEPTPTELAACVYRDVRKLRRQANEEYKASREEKKRQGVLL